MSRDAIRELQERRNDYEDAISKIDEVLKLLMPKVTRRRGKAVDQPPAPENGSTGQQMASRVIEQPPFIAGTQTMVAEPVSKPNGKPKGGDAPTLIRALKVIQARTDLSANERSAESLKARVAFKKGQSYVPPPVRKREGAVLGEAG